MKLHIQATANRRPNGRRGEDLKRANPKPAPSGATTRAPVQRFGVSQHSGSVVTSESKARFVGRLQRLARFATRRPRPERLTVGRWSPVPTLRSFVAWSVFAPLLAFLTVKGGREGTLRLRKYLGAPDSVKDEFDRKLAKQIAAETEFRRWMDEIDDDDPVPPRQPEGHIVAQPLTWDERWDKRARWRRANPDAKTYDREVLLALDLREVWPELTGEDVPHHGKVSCPSPDHEDKDPSCGVRESDWRCFTCGAHGTVIDLAAVVWDIEPTGRGFFKIAERLAA